MCGLVGVVSAKLPPLDSLHGMTYSLFHRGPDDGDVWVDPLGRIALGHRRLSINDLSTAGHQPMHSAGGRYALVFNGEIYNHQAIRSDLHLAGFPVSWRGHSDTETLLAALECWGLVSTLNKCIGMFAFALWDKQGGTLHLARDRFGEKPLYYGWVGSGENASFIFGSELKALESHPDFIKKISRSALAANIRFLYVPAPQSIYEDIYKLEPGCLLSINLPICLPPNKHLAAPAKYPGLIIQRWWALTDLVRSSASHLILDEDEAIYEVAKQLRDSVKLQLVSDVPLGAFLSGGIDSSLVTSLMQEQNSRPIKTFTVGFSEPSFDESPHALGVAGYLGTDHTELLVTPSDAMKVIPNLSGIYDEPFADSSQIPTYLICSLARQSVTVALSGDGGDEMFGGYNRHILAPKLWKYLSLVP
jgi:asparagine synthase (glutamine-hydrolysing)